MKKMEKTEEGRAVLVKYGKIKKKLNNKKNRSAFFVCSLTYKSQSKKTINVQGKIYGKISTKILGKNGFEKMSLLREFVQISKLPGSMIARILPFLWSIFMRKRLILNFRGKCRRSCLCLTLTLCFMPRS